MFSTLQKADSRLNKCLTMSLFIVVLIAIISHHLGETTTSRSKVPNLTMMSLVLGGNWWVWVDLAAVPFITGADFGEVCQ